MGKVQVVVGGQYGSEAKGAVAAWLAAEEPNPLMAIRVAGPNAGHTVIGEDGSEWKFRSIPTPAVTRRDATLALAAGSEVEKAVLSAELAELDLAGYNASSRMFVDRSATVLEDVHKAMEGGLVQGIGSTGKGVGAARSARAMRDASLYGGDNQVKEMATHHLKHGGTVIIEGTQGFGLGLHGDHYPYCTSSDCRAIDFLAMAGLSPWNQHITELEIWVVFRTFPIRVAGNSGHIHGELTWEQMANRTGGYTKPERTTVTNKIRRIGEWDTNLARAALAANGAPSPNLRAALMFVDYLHPDAAGFTGQDATGNADVRNTVFQFENRLLEHDIHLISTGPGAITRWRK